MAGGQSRRQRKGDNVQKRGLSSWLTAGFNHKGRGQGSEWTLHPKEAAKSAGVVKPLPPPKRPMPLVASNPEPVYILWHTSQQGTNRPVMNLCCRDSSQWTTRGPAGCAHSLALTLPPKSPNTYGIPPTIRSKHPVLGQEDKD